MTLENLRKRQREVLRTLESDLGSSAMDLVYEALKLQYEIAKKDGE